MKSCTTNETKKTYLYNIRSMQTTTTITLILCMSILLISSVLAATTATYSSSNYPIVSSSLVGTTPNPAVAGELLEVRIAFQNQGGQDSKEITTQFIPSFPFTLVPGDSDTQNIGILQAYQGSDNNENSKTIKYRIIVDKEAPAGTYDFTYQTTQAGNTVENKIPIEIKTANNAQTITIDTTSLSPGKPTNVTFTISNVGNAPLRNLVFTWSNSAQSILPVGSDNTRYIKYLDGGQSIALPFTVIADTNANAGLYKLDLSLSYENALDSSITKLVSTTAGMYIGGGTDFDVAYSESTSGQISLSVANVGNNAASSVSVIIPKQMGWRVSGSNTAIIGNLNKGDYTAVSFTLQQQTATTLGLNATTTSNAQAPLVGSATIHTRTRNASVNGTYAPTGTDAAGMNPTANSNSLLVDISYTNTAGQRETVEKQVSISSLSASGNSSGFAGRTSATQTTSFWSTYQWYIIGILAIVAAIYWYRKKKKDALLNSVNNDDEDATVPSMTSSKSKKH